MVHRNPITALNSASGVDRPGKFYISIPGIAGHADGEGGVAVIDPKTKKVVDTFIIPVDNCAAPQGMAVGPNQSDPARLQWGASRRRV